MKPGGDHLQKHKSAWHWDALCWTGLAALGFWIIYRFAAGTTPLRPDEYLWDSALFQAVGKLWADGMTPYVDIFDHKGPLLFLVQKLAYHFSKPRLALYVLESLMVSLSLGLGYQTLKLKWNRLLSFAGAVLMAVFWLPLMEYGNLCETHSMPWIMLSLYFQMRWFTSEKRRHPPLYAWIYGLCFGANVMIRPNNGVLIAVVTFVITVNLAVRGEWRNILTNAMALLAGMACIMAPFIAYFQWKDALNEFIYATWTFNLIYAESLKFQLDWQGIRNVLFFITPALMCIGLSGVCCIRRKWLLAAMNALSAAATLFVTLSGVGYAHYFMLHVPLIPLAFFTMHEAGDEKRLWQWILVMVCAGFAVITLRTTLPYACQNFLHPPTQQEMAREEAYDALVEKLRSRIPAEERDQVALCGLLVTDAEIILKSDLHPVGRYCFLMEWHSRADNSIRRRFIQTLQSGQGQWVIYREGGAGEEILRVLDEQYGLTAVETFEDTDYMLYRWK